MVVRGCKISLSAMQTSIRQKRPNFKIAYFRPLKCCPVQSAAWATCPPLSPFPPPLDMAVNRNVGVSVNLKVDLYST